MPAPATSSPPRRSPPSGRWCRRPGGEPRLGAVGAPTRGGGRCRGLRGGRAGAGPPRRADRRAAAAGAGPRARVPVRRPGRRRGTPLVEAWERAAAGARRVVLVGGDAGTGKTRLVTELSRWVHRRGAAVLYGPCSEQSPVPYEPFGGGARPAGRRPRPRRRAWLVRDHGHELARLVPRLADAARSPSAAPGRAPTDLRGAGGLRRPRGRAVPAVRRGGGHARRPGRPPARAARARRPALGPPADRRAARPPGRQPGSERLCIVATYRSTPAEVGDDLQGGAARPAPPARRVPADRCRASTTTGCGGSSAGGRRAGRPRRPGAAAVTDLLAGETGGNAFLLGELWRQLVEAGYLPEGRGALAGSPPARRRGQPGGRARGGRRPASDRLPDETRRLAAGWPRSAGLEFSTAVVAGASGLDQRRVLGARSTRRCGPGIVEEAGPGEHRFVHALVRRAVVDDLPGGRAAGAAPRRRPGRWSGSIGDRSVERDRPPPDRGGAAGRAGRGRRRRPAGRGGGHRGGRVRRRRPPPRGGAALVPPGRRRAASCCWSWRTPACGPATWPPRSTAAWSAAPSWAGAGRGRPGGRRGTGLRRRQLAGGAARRGGRAAAAGRAAAGRRRGHRGAGARRRSAGRWPSSGRGDEARALAEKDDRSRPASWATTPPSGWPMSSALFVPWTAETIDHQVAIARELLERRRGGRRRRVGARGAQQADLRPDHPGDARRGPRGLRRRFTRRLTARTGQPLFRVLDPAGAGAARHGRGALRRGRGAGRGGQRAGRLTCRATTPRAATACRCSASGASRAASTRPARWSRPSPASGRRARPGGRRSPCSTPSWACWTTPPAGWRTLWPTAWRPCPAGLAVVGVAQLPGRRGGGGGGPGRGDRRLYQRAGAVPGPGGAGGLATAGRLRRGRPVPRASWLRCWAGVATPRPTSRPRCGSTAGAACPCGWPTPTWPTAGSSSPGRRRATGSGPPHAAPPWTSGRSCGHAPARGRGRRAAGGRTAAPGRPAGAGDPARRPPSSGRVAPARAAGTAGSGARGRSRGR